MRLPSWSYALGAFLVVMVPELAHAQLARTFISATGNDANACTRTSPCRTLNAGINKAADGGVVEALSSGDYQPVTIQRSITVEGNGLLSIDAGMATGIIVNGPNIHVTVRSVRINGHGAGVSGVRILDGASVLLDDVRVEHVGGRGIDISYLSQASRTVITIRNSLVHDVASVGISASNSSGLPGGQFAVTIEGTTVSSCGGDAVSVQQNVNLTLVRCTLVDNIGSSSAGVRVAGAPSMAFVDGCHISGNFAGMSAGGGTIHVRNTVITRNGTGLQGANFRSLGRNIVLANISDGMLLNAPMDQ